MQELAERVSREHAAEVGQPAEGGQCHGCEVQSEAEDDEQDAIEGQGASDSRPNRVLRPLAAADLVIYGLPVAYKCRRRDKFVKVRCQLPDNSYLFEISHLDLVRSEVLDLKSGAGHGFEHLVVGFKQGGIARRCAEIFKSPSA